MDSEPLVSVIIPFYRNAEWLAIALDSVFRQSYRRFEVILVNDGSYEDISCLIERYGGRILYFEQDNKGPAAARNRGMDIAHGKYIAFLDSDDIWEADKLKLQVALMEEQNFVWSHTGYSNFKNGTDEYKSVSVLRMKGSVYPLCLYSCKIATPCVMIRRDILESRKLRFEEDLRYGEDTLIWCRLSLDYSLGLIEKDLARIRKTSKNASLDAAAQLISRAQMRCKMKMFPKEKLNMISGPGKLSFWWCDFVCRLFRIKKTGGKLMKILAGILYTPAYIGFKLAFILSR